jgi:6-phosphofructokinase 1
VQFAMTGDRDGSVAIKRAGDYATAYECVALSDVAGKTRTMEDDLIADTGTDITEAFRNYLRPLLGSDLPGAHRLRAGSVQKVLKA